MGKVSKEHKFLALKTELEKKINPNYFDRRLSLMLDYLQFKLDHMVNHG